MAKPLLARIMTKKHYRRIIAVGGVIALLLLVGYVRLPVAAVKSLDDYDGLADKPALYPDASRLSISPLQRWWLMQEMANLTEGDAAPRVSVEVQWNALLLARVRSGYRSSPTGAEMKECLYVWFLGAWVPVYTLNEAMS